jgi:hypothetical protein
MKKSLKLIAAIAATSLLLVSLTGCGGKDKNEIAFIAPIDGWEDITLPEESTFIRTNISGKVENHEYMTTLSPTELMLFLETAMENQGWTLNTSNSESRSFLKEGDSAFFTAKVATDEGTPVFIILEPVDAYGPSDVELDEDAEPVEVKINL